MAIFISTTFDDVNFPTIRAPGIHWEQADGLGDADVGQPTDGWKGLGAWTTTNGADDQIIAAANMAAGGGGKGFRHWVGNGVNNNGGSIQNEFPGGPVNEYWLRYYIRFQSGFGWIGTENMKTVYNQGLFYWGLHHGWFAGHIQNDGIDRNGWGQGNLRTPIAWADWQGGSVGDGLWHCVELHVKMNTGSSQNGTFEARLDGVLQGSWTDVRFTTSGEVFDFITFGENAAEPDSGSAADQVVDFDDIAFSDSGWVGPLNGGGGGGEDASLMPGFMVEGS